MYPLKLKKMWGGKTFEKSLRMKLSTNSNYGESWKVNTHLNGLSHVENGLLEKKDLGALVR